MMFGRTQALPIRVVSASHLPPVVATFGWRADPDWMAMATPSIDEGTLDPIVEEMWWMGHYGVHALRSGPRSEDAVCELAAGQRLVLRHGSSGPAPTRGRATRAELQRYATTYHNLFGYCSVRLLNDPNQHAYLSDIRHWIHQVRELAPQVWTSADQVPGMKGRRPVLVRSVDAPAYTTVYSRSDLETQIASHNAMFGVDAVAMEHFLVLDTDLLDARGTESVRTLSRMLGINGGVVPAWGSDMSYGQMLGARQWMSGSRECVIRAEATLRAPSVWRYLVIERRVVAESHVLHPLITWMQQLADQHGLALGARPSPSADARSIVENRVAPRVGARASAYFVDMGYIRDTASSGRWAVLDIGDLQSVRPLDINGFYGRLPTLRMGLSC